MPLEANRAAHRHTTSSQTTRFRKKIAPPGAARFRGGIQLNSGGRIRTCDLRVMSPTSYQTAPPRNGPRWYTSTPRLSTRKGLSLAGFTGLA